MSFSSLGGLAGLNALYLVSGAALLWSARGSRDWIDAVRLVGLAYLVGVVTTGSIWTLLLVAGVPFSLAVVLDSCGRWKVSYDAMATFAEGLALAENAHKAGFDARVEHEG